MTGGVHTLKAAHLLPHSWKQEGKLEGMDVADKSSAAPPVTNPPALNPACHKYLLGSKLQCLLPGFLKIFLLADVGLWSRDRGQ